MIDEIPITFSDLYNEALDIEERLTVIRLAKSALITKQEFEAAVKMREAESSLRNASDNLLRSLGRDLFTP